MSISEKPRSHRGRSNRALHHRAQRLLDAEIDFIDCPTFRQPNAAQEILRSDTVRETVPASSAAPQENELPTYLTRLCEADLLTAEDERILFRAMNYLKYRANVLRSKLKLKAPRKETICEAEKLLTQARAVRDRIISANMRLVISIVKKYVSPTVYFDELLSDGIMILMYAVEKFDYGRGFRFSTYAYRAVARNAYQQVLKRQKEHTRFPEVAEEHIEGALENKGTASMDEKTWETLRGVLKKFLRKLDKRERLIVEARYALGKYREKQTFQAIANKLGISKERVRQLERRAVGKLQDMAGQSTSWVAM